MALAMLLACVATAQTFRGRVEGIVTEESKAVITGATATLTNVNTTVRVLRKTSESGLYVFDSVDHGTYSVSIEVAGFNRFIQENILVQSGGDVTVNAVLKPGAVTSSVSTRRWPRKLRALTVTHSSCRCSSHQPSIPAAKCSGTTPGR